MVTGFLAYTWDMKGGLALGLTLLVGMSAMAFSGQQAATQSGGSVVQEGKEGVAGYGKFDPNRDAAKDISDGLTKAKKEHKRVILDVGGEWCGWCHKLDKLFREDEAIAKVLKDNYVVVKVNFSQENENKEVLSKYPEIKGYPHLFVLEDAGKLLHSQDTGLLETGPNHDPEKVMTFLKKWAPVKKDTF